MGQRDQSLRRFLPEVHFRLPSEELIDAFVLSDLEAETLVEALGGIEGLDVDGEHFGSSLGLFLQIAEKMGADALSAKFGQKGDIQDADLFFRVFDVKTACRHLFRLDDEKLRRG